MFCLFKKKRKIIFFLVVFLAATAYGENSTSKIICKQFEESEFPDDLFTKEQRKFGAVILHVILFLYSFGAIAVICEDYFLPTIKCICEDLKLSDDVAAATFMAIATSCPELFTNIIGTFVTKSDIGLAHVIGNGYYDMFFVAAVGGLAAKQDIVLEWWPLARDCSVYCLVAATLTIIVWDGIVQMHETIILLLLYVIYFFVMFNNKKIIKLISQKFNIEIGIKQNERINQSTHVFCAEDKKMSGKEKFEETRPLDSEINFTLPPVIIQTSKIEYKWWNLCKKIFCLPLRIITRYTIPDVRFDHTRKYYPLTFLLCIVWIGVTTYLGTWMISVIGETIGVPEVIMGMIFMAAGGSVVEAYSVYYKAKRGECSIGLSNSMGCNNLDATLCLALPWFIKTLTSISPSSCQSSSFINLQSPYIHINCLLLVISVIVLYLIFYSNKFKLNKKSGLTCGGVYIFVLVIAITVENYSVSV